MQMPGSFNAQQYQPNQGMSGHPPVLKAPFTVTGTAIVENKSKDGGFFQVELTSSLGTQIHRYNIWNKEPKAVEIAHGQLSALCHATGRYQIDWGNEGAALRGGQGLMDIGYQKGEEPTAEKPNGGYTELKKVYDLAGNEPGKVGQSQPQVQQTTQSPTPMIQQPGGSWSQGSGPSAQQQPQTAQQPTGWQQGQPQGQTTQQQPQSQPQGQAWQPGGGQQAETPPWGNR